MSRVIVEIQSGETARVVLTVEHDEPGTAGPTARERELAHEITELKEQVRLLELERDQARSFAAELEAEIAYRNHDEE